jgi:LuxR family transcriptional regulator, maltose regulon positive regulatory protein
MPLLRPPGLRCRPQAPRTWAWARWTTSGTSSTRRSGHASEGIALCRQFAYLPPLAAGLATLAWIREASGDPAGAREAIGEAGRASPGPAGLLNPVPAQRVRLLLAQGNLTEADRWTKECGLDADDAPDYSREREHLVLARVLLA